MPRRLLTAAAGLALLALLELAAATAPGTAGALLGAVRTAYTRSPSTTVTFVQSYAPAGFSATAPETGTLILQPPNLLRFEYDGPEGKLYTFDGTAARQYVAQDRQLIVRKLTLDERARLPLFLLQDPARVLARYDAAVRPAGAGLDEVVLTPKGGGNPKEIAFVVGAAGDVKRIGVLDSGGNRTTFTFTARTTGRRRPASDFAFVPPPGTKIVTP